MPDIVHTIKRKLERKKIYRYLVWLKHINSYNYKKERWYFTIVYGIGDLYFVSSLLPHFIRETGSKVSIIINKKNRMFIPALFSPEVEVINMEVPLELIQEFGSYKKGVPVILHPSHLFNRILRQLIGYHGFTFIDVYKILLGIDLNNKPCKPDFRVSFLKEVSEIFSTNLLPEGRTVLLCPRANSISLIDNEFWLMLAEQIMENGLIPVFLNSRFEAYKSLDFPLQYSIDFCDYAGHVVSIRSGFCDLTATSVAKKAVLYPDVKWINGKLIESTSLSKTGLCRNDEHLLEIIYSNDDKMALCNSILEFLK